MIPARRGGQPGNFIEIILYRFFVFHPHRPPVGKTASLVPPAVSYFYSLQAHIITPFFEQYL